MATYCKSVPSAPRNKFFSVLARSSLGAISVFPRSAGSCSRGRPLGSSLRTFFQRVSNFILSLQTIVFDCAFFALNFFAPEDDFIGKRHGPQTDFLHQGGRETS